MQRLRARGAREYKLKVQDLAIERFNLIRNRNGFEESIETGTKQDLERMRLDLEFESTSDHETERGQAWDKVTYYVVPKREWDLEHCPLMPVDFS